MITVDHIALPSKGGAMENWGLITYGEPYFAVNPEVTPAAGRQLAASFIAHELAHQVVLYNCSYISSLKLCYQNAVKLSSCTASRYYFSFRPSIDLYRPIYVTAAKLALLVVMTLISAGKNLCNL